MIFNSAFEDHGLDHPVDPPDERQGTATIPEAALTLVS
jgi:hypothetical protein